MEDIGMNKLGILGLVIIVFGILVISILYFDKGCSKLDMGFAPFSGKFEHCAFAAGQATKSAVLGAGISEDIAGAASSAAAESAAESLKEGKSPKEAASAAAAAAFKAADGEGANRKEAIRAAATAGAAAAAAASSTSEADAKIATKAAAYAVATGKNAKQLALELGASESVASNAASGAAEGEKAEQQLKDHPPSMNGPEPLTNKTPVPGDNATGNIVPVANGGDDQTVPANTEVTLDGSKSIDKDGTLVSYKWKQTGGPKVHIKDTDKAMASFNAPSVSEGSKLAFRLTVTDDQDASNSDKVSINVKSNSESQPIEDKSNPESQPSEDKNNTESKS